LVDITAVMCTQRGDHNRATGIEFVTGLVLRATHLNPTCAVRCSAGCKAGRGTDGAVLAPLFRGLPQAGLSGSASPPLGTPGLQGTPPVLYNASIAVITDDWIAGGGPPSVGDVVHRHTAARHSRWAAVVADDRHWQPRNAEPAVTEPLSFGCAPCNESKCEAES
jgi:hypothetical protein